MSYLDIPEELKLLRQWCVCNDDRIPKHPTQLHNASPVNPSTWGSYDEAVLAVSEGWASYIGLVLTKEDPYCFLDFDNKQLDPVPAEVWADHWKLITYLNSYTEESVSGRGQHTIVRATLEAACKTKYLEMYDRERFCIFTGELTLAQPIREAQQAITMLWSRLKGQTNAATYTGPAEEQKEDDQSILTRAFAAQNGTKISDLYHGRYQGYPEIGNDNSTADFSFIHLLTPYTRNSAQLQRIFLASPLARRGWHGIPAKDNKYAKRPDLIMAAIQKAINIWHEEHPPVDYDAMRQSAAALLEQHAPKPVKPTSDEIPFPPGLTGRIAEFVFNTAQRPVKEYAIAAALAFMSGVCGREYNVSGTGLNQYIIALGETGTNKEAMADGLDRLMSAVREHLPGVGEFRGPAVFASGQGMNKTFQKQIGFFAVLGEFGVTLQQICDPRASGPQKSLMQSLLDLFGKSGRGRLLQGTAYSDSEKTTNAVISPAVTLLGDSTQSLFFEGLSDGHAVSGLLPRFTLIEYKGTRPDRNRKASGPPDAELTQMATWLADHVLRMRSQSVVVDVIPDQEADETLEAYERAITEKMRKSTNEVHKALLNRAHLKALKISAVLAIGVNPVQPVINTEMATWAINLVDADVGVMMKRFVDGDIGDGSNAQIAKVASILKTLWSRGREQLLKMGLTEGMIADKVMPLSMVQQRVANTTGFKGASPSVIFNGVVKQMVDYDYLVELSPVATKEKYGRGGRCVGIGTMFQKIQP